MPALPLATSPRLRALACLAAFGCSSGGGDEPAAPGIVVGALRVVRHETQPMVVDVHATLGTPGRLSGGVESDPGVRALQLEAGSATDVTLRFRGLAPGAHHEASVVATLDDGRSKTLSVSFDTLDGLFGHRQQIEVTATAEPSPHFRLYDAVTSSLGFSDDAIYVLDVSGTTRFYLPHPTMLTGLNPVPKGMEGLKLLADGTFIFNQDHDFWIVDELGQEQVHVLGEDVDTSGLHHDVIQLPGGTFVAIATRFQDVTVAGSTFHYAGDELVEFTRDGQVVWRWSSFDHLDPARVRDGYQGRFPDPRTGQLGFDWTHANGVIYRAEDDLLLLSLRHQDWILAIDHKSGDVLWKLGDGGDFSLQPGERWFYHQHSPEWQPDGSLLVYDDGNGNPNVDDLLERTRVTRWVLDFTQKTAQLAWQNAGDDYFTPVAGDVDRLTDTRVLVTDSEVVQTFGHLYPYHARVREVDTTTGQDVWRMDEGVGRMVYRCIPTRTLPGEPHL